MTLELDWLGGGRAVLRQCVCVGLAAALGVIISGLVVSCWLDSVPEWSAGLAVVVVAVVVLWSIEGTAPAELVSLFAYQTRNGRRMCYRRGH